MDPDSSGRRGGKSKERDTQTPDRARPKALVSNGSKYKQAFTTAARR